MIFLVSLVLFLADSASEVASDAVTDTTGISVMVGALVPLVISLIIRTTWQRPAQEIAAFGTCIVAALIIAWLKGELTSAAPVEAFGVVYALARASYLTVWKPTTIAPKLEAATS